MEWHGKWNGIQKIPEWNGIFQWNERQSSILSCQFHTRFQALYYQKNIYTCQVVINDIVTEVFNFNIYVYYLSTNRGTMVMYPTSLTSFVVDSWEIITTSTGS